MQIPEAVERWLVREGQGTVISDRPVAGGCISNGRSLLTDRRSRFFLKTNPSAPADMFRLEAEGLALIDHPGGPRVPAVYLVGQNFLLLEDLQPASPAPDYWEAFGRQLAALHLHTAPAFGAPQTNYIGSTPQPNPTASDGFDFFAENRLRFQAELAGKNGRLSHGDIRRILDLTGRLRDWIPEQAPAPIHGDLWSGNMISDSAGAPAFIDPAAHYGWPEADLAMTALFGRPPGAFYQAYEAVRPLPGGFWERAELYNLYHLLNHLNLFGAAYLGQVRQVLARFS